MGANETMGFIDVTPAMAAEWLEHNMPNNRTIKKDVVKQYAEDMARGAWEKSYEPIVFNKQGLLENGQHRLKAICMAKVPVTLFVVQNAESAPGSYDRGAARTARDSLCVRNNIDKRYSQDTHIAIANSVYRDFGVPRTSDALREAFLTAFGSSIDACVCASRQCRQNGKSLCLNATTGKVLFYALQSGFTDIGTIYRFCLIVNSGLYESNKETAAIVMRNQLLTAGSLSGSKRIISGHGREKILERITSAALVDFVNEKPRKNFYNVENCSTPVFVDNAKKLIKAEITNA